VRPPQPRRTVVRRIKGILSYGEMPELNVFGAMNIGYFAIKGAQSGMSSNSTVL
jgi:hypothetical protein